MPDMKRVYVVEFLPKGANPQDPAVVWPSFHTTDDAQEAVRVAKEDKEHDHVRVRQFWVQSFHPKAFSRYGEPSPLPVPVEDLTEYTCLDHPDASVRSYKGGQTPRCPDCKKDMVERSFADSLSGPIKSLGDLK